MDLRSTGGKIMVRYVGDLQRRQSKAGAVAELWNWFLYSCSVFEELDFLIRKGSVLSDVLGIFPAGFNGMKANPK